MYFLPFVFTVPTSAKAGLTSAVPNPIPFTVLVGVANGPEEGLTSEHAFMATHTLADIKEAIEANHDIKVDTLNIKMIVKDASSEVSDNSSDHGDDDDGTHGKDTT